MAEYQEAINLNPSYAPAHVMLGAVYTYRGEPEKALSLCEQGIRLSPSDPRLFIWLPLLAGAHYQMRHYTEAVEIGRRSWSLNRNWPHGLRYAVAGLGQLGRLDDARAALDELRAFDANLDAAEAGYMRTYQVRDAIDHILDGLRKAGFE